MALMYWYRPISLRCGSLGQGPHGHCWDVNMGPMDDRRRPTEKKKALQQTHLVNLHLDVSEAGIDHPRLELVDDIEGAACFGAFLFQDGEAGRTAVSRHLSRQKEQVATNNCMRGESGFRLSSSLQHQMGAVDKVSWTSLPKDGSRVWVPTFLHLQVSAWFKVSGTSEY